MRLKLFSTCFLLAFVAGCGSRDENRNVIVPTADEKRGISLRIDADPTLYKEASNDISDILYGIFLEDINHALDGGMYAELFKNRSFEFGKDADRANYHGWIVSGEDIDFTVFHDNEPIDPVDTPIVNASPLNPYNLHYARITFKSGSWAGIGNRGFLKGLAVEAGNEYRFSAFLKAPETASAPNVRIQLRNTNGDVFAEMFLGGISDEWQMYEGILIPTETVTENLRLFIEIDSGALYMDMISLKPVETFKGTVIRKDIGEYLEALKPGFIRFPGGCVVEGRCLETIYNWKDSIGNGRRVIINGKEKTGDITVRPQGSSIWRGSGSDPYYTTHGFGFYEFFLLCELFGSEPVPVLNAGMTCEIQSPKYIVFGMDSDEFKQAVQDALDLVEFARGDPDTYWGKVRADMGHEEPFHLRYIAIGNEQWQREYFAHYRAFVEAFDRAALEKPELFADLEFIIANGAISRDRMGWHHVSDYPDQWTTLVDEHYYEPPEWFFANTTRYDSYKRNAGAGVFLGEYAAKSNTMVAALAEAAYMTGLERNSDIVRLASYAPLFGNSRSTQWTPNLIWFCQLTVHGSVNYYVQKMFSQNLGVSILKSELDLPEPEISNSLEIAPRLLYETVSIAENGDVIIKLVNPGEADVAVDIKLENLDLNNYLEAVVTVLQGEALTHANNFVTPDKITPVTSNIDVTQEFTYVVPGFSVNVVRLKYRN